MPRFAESSNAYPFVVAQLRDGWRVIECANDMQWIVQCAHGKARWDGVSFCRTKESLLRCAGEPHPALLALPDCYPDGHRYPREAGESEFQEPEVSGAMEETKISLVGGSHQIRHEPEA